MWISTDTMLRMYRTAKNKNEQIEILAELNACHPAEIRQALGLEMPAGFIKPLPPSSKVILEPVKAEPKKIEKKKKKNPYPILFRDANGRIMFRTQSDI